MTDSHLIPDCKAQSAPIAGFGKHKPGKLASGMWRLATLGGAFKSLRKPLRRHVARHAPGPFDVEVSDIRFRLYPEQNHTDRMIFGQRTLPEPRELALLKPYLKSGMNFVDVGANIGLYSLFVACQTKDTATILAFEPMEVTRWKLLDNIGLNRFRNINVVAAAAGAQSGQHQLHFDLGGNVGGASLHSATTKPCTQYMIDMTTIPMVCEQHNISAIDALKVDVEGYEDQALRPLIQEHMQLLPKVLLIETVHQHLWQFDLFEQLYTCGYKCESKTIENQLLVRN